MTFLLSSALRSHPLKCYIYSFKHIQQVSHIHVARKLRYYGKSDLFAYLKSRNRASSIIVRYESSASKPIEQTVSQNVTATSQSNSEATRSSQEVPNPSIAETELPITEIPDIPVGEQLLELNSLGEPTLASLGLCNWTPVGLVQRALEFIHVTGNLPWWATIVVSVVVIRICVFPLVIMGQRNSIKMNNYMPKLQELQMEMSRARMGGNQIDALRAGYELQTFMATQQISPFKSMMVPLIQSPIFISMFMALRSMSHKNVESLTVGGLWWFTDLTVPDQYYLLPLLTSTTLWVTLELGVDIGKMQIGSVWSQYIGYGIKVIPFVVFPFIMNFPGSILVYWLSTNLVSLVQVAFLRIPAVRDYFEIQPKIKHDPKALPAREKKGFVKDIKENWTNMRITREIEERDRLDQMNFQRAGRTPPVKTYKYNPTLIQPPAQAKAKN